LAAANFPPLVIFYIDPDAATMNKTLFACLLATVFCSAAQAQVAIYGVIDYALITKKEDGTNRRNALDSGVSAESRIGFRGTEDLGNGLKVGFTLENGFSGDTGETDQNGRLFGRAAWVNMVGRFGELRAGRQDTFGFEWLPAASPFGTSYRQAQFGTIFGYQNVADRVDNALFYFTPNFKGFEAGIGYTRSSDGQEDAGNEKDNAVLSAGARYNNGPLMLVFSYDRKDDAKANHDSGRDDIEHMGLGATYDFKVVKLYAAIGQLKNRDFNAHADKEKSWLVGLSAPLGERGLLFGTYQHVNSARNRNQFGLSGARKGLALGYGHTLSKRTNLYAVASRYENVDQRADNKLKLADATEIGFGVRHNF